MVDRLITYYHNNTNKVIVKLKREDTSVYFKKIDYEPYFFILLEDVEKVKELLKDFIYTNTFNGFTSKIIFTFTKENDKYAKVFYTDIASCYLLGMIKAVNEILVSNNIQSFELDLLPGDNYILDNDFEISENYRILFWDIETRDDTGDVVIGRDRILSICAVDNLGNKFTFCDDDEKIILLEFTKLLENYDIIVGWNSRHFDIPYIKARLQYQQIYFSFKSLIDIDLMIVFMDSFAVKTRIGKKFLTSYSLNNICKEFINDSKLEIHDGGNAYGGAIYKLFNENRDKLIEYNLQDCILMKRLDEEFNLIKNEIVLAKLVKAPLSKTRTLMTMIDMLLIREARKRNMHLRTKPFNSQRAEYEGGYVLEAKAKLYHNVNIVDFASLYPSLFRTFNISEDVMLNEETNDCIKLPTGVMFKQERGLIPSILDNLTELRLKLKAEQKELNNKGLTQEALLKEFEQTAVKVLILSIYGISGSAFARVFNLKIAEGVTLTGQHMIKSIISSLNSNGYNVVLADTDSAGFEMKENSNIEEVFKIINSTIEIEVKKCGVKNTNYLKMEHERVLNPFIVLAKKKYVGLDIKRNELYYKGIELSQSSQLKITKRLLEDILKKILIENANEKDCEKLILEYRKKIINRNIDNIEDLVITKKCGRMPETYKSMPVHVELAAKRREKGQPYFTSMRIPFIVVSKKPLKIVHLEDFNGKYDENYYWSVQIFPPTYRLLTVVFPNHNWDKFLYGDKGLQFSLNDYGINKSNMVNI